MSSNAEWRQVQRALAADGWRVRKRSPGSGVTFYRFISPEEQERGIYDYSTSDGGIARGRAAACAYGRGLLASKLRAKTFTAEPCPGCAERDARIAELEKRPTHESIVQWLAEEHGTAAVPRYRAEFMEPTDAEKAPGRERVYPSMQRCEATNHGRRCALRVEHRGEHLCNEGGKFGRAWEEPTDAD